MAVTVTQRVRARPETVWALLAEPARWSAWAPHLRGAEGLGTPEVAEGARGAARLLGVVPVPATIVGKEPGRSWTWRVGPVTLAHRVDAAPGGAMVRFDVSAPAPLERVLRVTYAPVIALVARNLARVAAAGPA
jgi:hypothetical protein